MGYDFKGEFAPATNLALVFVKAQDPIKVWQLAAYENAVSKGFHNCKTCGGDGSAPDCIIGGTSPCLECNGTGLCPPSTYARIGARLALIHCEISEAVECLARNKCELHWLTNVHGGWHEDVHSTLTDAEKSFSTRHKPEGLGIELADVFLRLCDLAQSLGLLMVLPTLTPDNRRMPNPEELACELNNLHTHVSRIAPGNLKLAYEIGDAQCADGWTEAAEDQLNRVLRALFEVSAMAGVDLMTMAELKHAYNLTRPIMHGGKVL